MQRIYSVKLFLPNGFQLAFWELKHENVNEITAVGGDIIIVKFDSGAYKTYRNMISVTTTKEISDF